MNPSLNRIHAFTLIAFFATIIGCDHSEPSVQSGKVTFSFTSRSNSGGRQKNSTPARVAYTLKKTDGTTTEGSLELFEFNGNFLTHELQVNTGFYTLEQFLVMNNENKVIYAAPKAGSDMASLVEQPLPLPVGVATGELTPVIPEVLAVEDHTSEDFGYIAFGLNIVNTASFKTHVSIADNLAHDPIDYTLEIIAKDAPLGTVRWRTLLSLSETSTIQFPTRYVHYTFRAIKPGYIPHVQHFRASQLPDSGSLNFEFLPEALEDFFVIEEPNALKLYVAKDRCKLYARFDVPEGTDLTYTFFDRAAYIPGTGPIASHALECYPDTPSYPHCSNNVNFFDNQPYAQATDFCSGLAPQGKTLDDVDIDAFAILYYTKHLETQEQEFIYYNTWPGSNNN
jgi:hypothetical protein